MAKRTTIIDIGSNSISLVIYEKSSRFAFHLIEKVRSRVRIGEGAYANGGILRQEAMDRAFHTLSDFMRIAKSYKSQKILCVATSALRDAPNKVVFLKRVRDELKLNIKVIDGEREAYFGALAACNLLPPLREATTIDIGGGSTELAKIKDGKIVQTLSLDIGTVRLKELFFDQKKGFKEAKAYTKEIAKTIPDSFQSEVIVGIGGTIRSLSNAIMQKQNYPLETLHGYSYKYKKHAKFIKKVAKSSLLELKEFPISSNRYDTIREGSTIFYTFAKRLDAKEVFSSKAGVREGVYLHDILRNSNFSFPQNFNVSIKSLMDRFALLPKHCVHTQKVAKHLYEALYKQFDPEKSHENSLLLAARLIHIFKRLNIYSNSDYSFFFLLENLNFALSHRQKILITVLLRFGQKGKVDQKMYGKYQSLLPALKPLEWLSFIISLSECLTRNKSMAPIGCHYNDSVLTLEAQCEMFLAQECIKKVKKPKSFAISFVKSSS